VTRAIAATQQLVSFCDAIKKDMGRMRRLGIFACNLNPRKHMLPRTLMMPFDQPMLPGWNPNLI
jgi:hypothetical protein